MEWAAGHMEKDAFGPHPAEEFHRPSQLHQLALAVLPTLSLMILSPLYLRHYYRQPVRALPGRLLWTKLVRSGTEL